MTESLHWLRAGTPRHACIDVVSCPQCKATPGQPCIGARGPVLQTHYRRRDAYRELRRAQKRKNPASR